MAKQRDVVQMIGSQTDQTTKPMAQVEESFMGGMEQIIGSEVNLSRRPTPMADQTFDKGIQGGRQQWVGSQVDLNRTPHRDWDSYATPTSDGSDNPDSTRSGFNGPVSKYRK